MPVSEDDGTLRDNGKRATKTELQLPLGRANTRCFVGMVRHIGVGAEHGGLVLVLERYHWK